MIIPVILAGGSGTRLWPLSRADYPKQFLNLTNEFSLLENTLDRVSSKEYAAPLIVCNQSHRFLVAEQIRHLAIENAQILLEPESKNTAPAIALAAFHALTSHKDPYLLVLSADHSLDDKDVFNTAINHALNVAKKDYLVSLGVPATTPETGYGYIEPGNSIEQSHGFVISNFIEKPNIEVAQTYVDSGRYMFNTGIFLFRASLYLEELNKFHPCIYTGCKNAAQNTISDLDFIRVKTDAFSMLPSQSIDYAVMEKTKCAAVVPLSCSWSDIGSYNTLWNESRKCKQGNVIKGDVVAEKTRDSLIIAENKLVATLGVEDLVIVDTKDALLVSSRDQAQDVKQIVARLFQENRLEYSSHREVYRPWGKYDTVDVGGNFLVKRVTVKPGGQLSLQKHQFRAEHWIVVKGVAKTKINGIERLVSENESIYIPIGATHRLENSTDVDLELIEVQTGDYLSEDDIIRLSDKYNRVEN